MGKGDTRRPGDEAAIAANWERTFGAEKNGVVETGNGVVDDPQYPIWDVPHAPDCEWWRKGDSCDCGAWDD